MTLEELLSDYRCENLTDMCEARNYVKSLQLLSGEEMCQRQCCIGCDHRCGYACGHADEVVRELNGILKDISEGEVRYD